MPMRLLRWTIGRVSRCPPTPDRSSADSADRGTGFQGPDLVSARSSPDDAADAIEQQVAADESARDCKQHRAGLFDPLGQIAESALGAVGPADEVGEESQERAGGEEGEDEEPDADTR